MSFLDSKTHSSGVLAGIYLVNAVVAPLPLFYAVSAQPSSIRAQKRVTNMMDTVDCCQRQWCYQACLCRCYC